MDQTIIYVTHDVKEGLFLGDSIVYIGDGEVVRKGSPEEIWNNPESFRNITYHLLDSALFIPV